MTTRPRDPRATPHTDAYGCPYKREFGETRRPIRSRYGLGERAVFEDLSRSLIDNPSVHAMLMHVYAAGMPVDDAMALLVEGVAHARSEMSRIEVIGFVAEMVPKLLSASATDRLRTQGKTARADARTARRKLVRSLKAYRR
ncbi:MAG: hypothetical protein EOO77_47550 [Oxalobacteraceae bacterium]|nr:MAG: hypothetical protein EOO77_47550 [Oxalobacteraceae bacterium]